jgi:tetratricopeptide (TPR) repeat protein
MSSRIACRLLVSMLVLSHGSVAEADNATRDSNRTRAVELFGKGNAAFAAGDVEGAYRAYSEAWKLSQSYDIACNLARVEAELGQRVKAAEHLRYCLDNFSASSRPELREAERKFEALLATLQSELGRLTMFGLDDDVEVLVDGVVVGRAPFVSPVYVEPGTRVVETRQVGRTAAKFTVHVPAGEQRVLDIALARDDAEPAPATAPPAPTVEVSAPRPASALPWVLMGGAATTLVAASVGSYAILNAASHDRDADRLTGQALSDPNGAGCVGDSTLPVCADLAESVSRAQDSEKLARLAFTAAGVLGAATITTWLVWPTRETPRSEIALTASILPDGTRLSVAGRF